jgi:serine/threonine-protein kinase
VAEIPLLIRAVIVDDESPARERLTTLLAAHANIRVIGEAGDVATAADLCARLAPDLVFLDVELRGDDGFDLLSYLSQPTSIIFVTAHAWYALRAFEVNALDYLQKPIHPDRLAAALSRLSPPPADSDPSSGEADSGRSSASMGSERWQLIQELYEEIRTTPAAGRAPLLDKHCAGDTDLRYELESLVQADDDAGNFLTSDELKELIGDLGPQPAASLLGTAVGRYRLASELGAGAMGVVYLADDTTLDRKVALKLLPAEFTQDAGRTSRFVREAKTASGLNHPNILTIHEIGQTGETWFIATEFVEGVTLRQRLESGPLAVEEALDIATQCVAALDSAHRAGIVHRDVKPENIMIRSDAVVKVIDFGLAVVAKPAHDQPAGATEAGKIIGTPRYMSPEQARGEKLDGRSDIFSLGTVLYEMIEGAPAFAGATAAEVFAKLLRPGSSSAVKTSSTLRAYPALERVLTKALNKSPEARYQTMGDFASDLKALRGQLESRRKLGRSRRWILAAGVTVLALSVLAVSGVRSGIWNRFFPQRIQSLAVLPLLNLSADPQQDYLVDGMTDNLITEIARATSIRVISRTSIMQYKGISKHLPEIANTLDVDGVIEGSVRKSDGRLYITVQLLDARKDRHLWARNYERPQGELLSLTGEIAQDVTHQLNAAASSHAGVVSSVNPQAYDLYLRGRYAWNKRSGEGYREALQYFNQSIEKEPKYAPAYAGLADSYLLLGEYLIWPSTDAFTRARAAARQALAFDPSLGEAYASLAQIAADEWNWPEADRAFQRAVELRSGYATAHQWRAEFLLLTGRIDESVSEIKQAQELDPLSPIINTQLGWILTSARRYDEAITQLQRTIEMAPRFAPAHADLGIAYDAKGDHAEALEAFQKANEIDRTPDRDAWIARQYALSGQTARAREMLGPLRGLAAQSRVSPATLALVFIALGEYEEAFKLMEAGCRMHSLAPLKVYPPFDPIRSDPRFSDALRCMHLEP